jgi:hypothetical protein
VIHAHDFEVFLRRSFPQKQGECGGIWAELLNILCGEVSKQMKALRFNPESPVLAKHLKKGNSFMRGKRDGKPRKETIVLHFAMAMK